MSESTEVAVPWLHPGEILLLKLKTAVSLAAHERLRECMKDLVERAREGPTCAVLEEGATFEVLRSGWIPVSERLPKPQTWVLVQHGNGELPTVGYVQTADLIGPLPPAWWTELSCRWHWSQSHLDEADRAPEPGPVTHWMPLPEPSA